MKNNTSENKKNKSDCSFDLLQVFIVVVGALVIYYLYQKYYQNVETFTENKLSNKKVGELSDEEKISFCNPEKQKIRGFRSLQSGATLKFELAGEPNENNYFLHGPPYKVVTVDIGNSLTLKAKNEVEKSKQVFKKVEKDINGNKCLVFTYGNDNPQLALQYEHEHLSLRPLNINGVPFSGQCFVAYEGASISEIEANSLSLGISVPRLGNEDLMGSGHNNLIRGSTSRNNNKTGDEDAAKSDNASKSDNAAKSDNNAEKSTTSEDTIRLNELTKTQFEELMDRVIDDVTIYKKETNGGKPDEKNTLGTGLNVNVNLQKQEGEVDGDTFTDLKGDNSSSSVRALLNTYTKSKKGTSFLEQMKKGDGLQDVKDVLRNKFKGCPGFDRSKYYSERQIAQCSGCSPDEFLRGKL